MLSKIIEGNFYKVCYGEVFMIKNEKYGWTSLYKETKREKL
jgi:hypothetical protein